MISSNFLSPIDPRANAIRHMMQNGFPYKDVRAFWPPKRPLAAYFVPRMAVETPTHRSQTPLQSSTIGRLRSNLEVHLYPIDRNAQHHFVHPYVLVLQRAFSIQVPPRHSEEHPSPRRTNFQEIAVQGQNPVLPTV